MYMLYQFAYAHTHMHSCMHACHHSQRGHSRKQNDPPHTEENNKTTRMCRTPHNKPSKNTPNMDGLKMQNNKPPQNKLNADITESRTTSHPKARDRQGREATNPPPPHWQAQSDALADARHCYSSKTSPIDSGIPLTIARSSHRKGGSHPGSADPPQVLSRPIRVKGQS